MFYKEYYMEDVKFPWPSCEPAKRAVTKILVATGFGSYDDVEVLDLWTKTSNCPNLTPFASGRVVGATGTLVDGMAVICGGRKEWLYGTDEFISDECYNINKISTELFSQMTTGRLQ